MRIHFTLFSLLLLHTISDAQPFPDTDIFLCDVMITAKGISFSTPVNFTHRVGYDNQPCFTPDGKSILYSSIRKDGQADVYAYEINTRKESRVTVTKESEYSPTIMPDRKNFSVVRVEKDSTQRIWQFPLQGGEPSLLFSNVDSIGYHCWTGKDSAAFFILTEPPTLQLVSGKTIPFILSQNIGRCMRMIPSEHALSFVEKTDTTHWFIKRYDLSNSNLSVITPCLSQSEDYTWLLDGTILMGHEGKIFQYRKNASGWKEVADFSAGIEHIGRLSMSADGKRIAIVGVAKK